MDANPNEVLEEEPRFGKKEKLNMAIMESSTASIEVISSKLPIYYTDFIGMSSKLFGRAHLLFAIVNAINDPILGYFMDRAPHKNGVSKYRKFIKATIPVAILAIIIMLMGQPSWPTWILFILVFLGLSLRDTAYAMQGISASSIIIQNEKSDSGRGAYVGLRLTLKAIFAVAGFLIPSYFLTGSKDSTIPPLLMFLGFGIVGIVLFIIPARKVNPPIKVDFELERKSSMGKVLLRMLKMKSYVTYIIIAFLISGIALNQELFMLYFADDVMELSGTMTVIVSALVIPLIIGANFSSRYLIKKFGVRKLLIVTTVTLIVTNVTVLLQINNVLSIACLLISVTAGNYWLLIKFPITGIIIDEYASKFGERNEGTFLGVDSIFHAPAISVFLAIFLAIIDKIGYIGTADFQPPVVKQGMLLTMTLMTIIACTIALIVILFLFPIGKKKK
ncbi:MAG: MFS transporter [Promethearchaeota archaeon]